MPAWMLITLITVAYLAIVLVIGVAARDAESSTLEGYIAGGRSMGMLLLFFILGAEIFSAFTFLGGPGWAYSRGAPALYILAYLGLVAGAMWWLAPRIRRISARHKHLTQADMMADRFGSRWLAPVIGIVSIGGLIPYLTVQIAGTGLLFHFATGERVPFWLGALLALIVMVSYVYTSGLRGIGWTNVMQGLLMVVVAWVLGLAVANSFYGGVGDMFQQIAAKAPEYLTLPGGGKPMIWTGFATAILVSAFGGLMWPHIFMRFYAADNERSLKQAFVIYPLYAYLVVPILFIGFAGILVYQGQPLDRVDDVLLSLTVSSGKFSPWLVGFMLSGALAAAMSTGANLAHVAATVAVRDCVHVVWPGMSEASSVRLIKQLVILVSALAYGFALFNPASLVALLLATYGILVQLLPLAIATLFWRRANRAGAFVGLILGSAVTLWFTFGPAAWFGIHAGIWGLLVNTIALVGISLATPAMDEQHLTDFYGQAAQ